ncbi:hypothetical protein [Pseudomonas sp. dw_358]|uniref:hypothetical protein n=1 Tax=Pseudomonas sp. dw_358 TaxID=2720083 RepID=UPI001BD330A3|nr:hypothetical protein [Pseudomonas sp. dw_358]
MTEPRTHSRTRRFWDGHGSWLLLLIVGISCWMAGSQYSASTMGSTIQILVNSQDKETDSYRQRIRELHDQIDHLNTSVQPVVQQAAKDASTAAAKASEAADSAAKAVDKVTP